MPYIRRSSPLQPDAAAAYEPLEEKTDILFYEGLHGGVVTEDIDVAQHVDLLIGMVPVSILNGHKNLRIQVTEDIPKSGYDAYHQWNGRLRKYITPQFSRTHINFKSSTVDSNPFGALTIPTNDESFVVVLQRYKVYTYLLNDRWFIHVTCKYISSTGRKMGLAIDLI